MGTEEIAVRRFVDVREAEMALEQLQARHAALCGVVGEVAETLRLSADWIKAGKDVHPVRAMRHQAECLHAALQGEPGGEGAGCDPVCPNCGEYGGTDCPDCTPTPPAEEEGG